MTKTNTGKFSNDPSITADPLASRIVAYDLARALALFGMILINFNVFLEDPKPEPAWLFWILEKIEGRAAALFVVLAGTGLSLMTRRAYLNGNLQMVAKNRKSLLKRALFLLIAGLLNRIFWSADILLFYGIYLMIGILFLMVSGRHLWFSAAIFMAGYIALLYWCDFDKEWVFGSRVYADYYYLKGMLCHIFFKGYYPVFPWMAFLLVGMWLGRQDFSNVVTRKRILWFCVGTVCLVETLLWVMNYVSSMYWDFSDYEYIEMLLEMDPWHPMPQFLISGGGSAIAVIMICFFLADRFNRSRLLPILVTAGQMSLTLYISHILFAVIIAHAVPDILHSMSLLTGMAIVFYFAALMSASFWNARFGRGPLELIMRRFLVSSKTLATSNFGGTKINMHSFSSNPTIGSIRD